MGNQCLLTFSASCAHKHSFQVIKCLDQLTLSTTTIAQYSTSTNIPPTSILLNMKTTIAGTWKSLVWKLHPLSMSSQESQRLRVSLNDSFKQQLDREHKDNPSSNENNIDCHLLGILTDPLLSYPRKPFYLSNKNPLSSKLQSHTSWPMDSFKDRVSQGRASLETAAFYLHVQRQICFRSSAATTREVMRSSGAASIILQWLWSSGNEETGAFLLDHAFCSNLINFLVAEGQLSPVLRWLRRCNTPEEMPFSSLHGAKRSLNYIEGRLFRSLIRAEMNLGHGLESAMTLCIQTVASLQSSGSTGISTQLGAARAVSILTKALCGPKAAEPKPSIVRDFFEMTRNLGDRDPTSCIPFHLCPNAA